MSEVKVYDISNAKAAEIYQFVVEWAFRHNIDNGAVVAGVLRQLADRIDGLAKLAGQRTGGAISYGGDETLN